MDVKKNELLDFYSQLQENEKMKELKRISELLEKINKETDTLYYYEYRFTTIQ